MQELIAVIHAALASDATAEQKTAGAQACNTIAAALGTEPGKQLVLPTTPQRSPLAGISFDQVLDLAIAKLTAVASANDAKSTPVLSAPAAALPARAGLRVPAHVALPPSIVRAVAVPRSTNVARPANPARASKPRTTIARPTAPAKR